LNRIEILEIERIEIAHEFLTNFSIDLPQVGYTSETEVFINIAGWLHSANPDNPVRCVELLSDYSLLRRVKIDIERNDVVEYFGLPQTKAVCGFWTQVGLIGLAPEFEILVQAVLMDKTYVKFARIRGQRQPFKTDHTPELLPISVTSLGRTGTTLLMNVLAEHPEVIVDKFFPYETRNISYFTHLFKVLSEPASLNYSTHPDEFQYNFSFIGHNPFFSAPVTDRSEVNQWFSQTYVENLAVFCQQSIESYYQKVAQAQNNTRAKHFAEKVLPNHTARLLNEFYPQVCEIFLVRDIRDMLASIKAFNIKRNQAGFGANQYSDEMNFISHIVDGYNLLAREYSQRATKGFLVHYEDLVQEPGATIMAMLNYVGLDSSPQVMENLIGVVRNENNEVFQHRTSQSQNASVGRWRTDLSPEIQAVARELAGQALLSFGYNLD
jgi:hypothetical protein